MGAQDTRIQIASVGSKRWRWGGGSPYSPVSKAASSKTSSGPVFGRPGAERSLPDRAPQHACAGPSFLQMELREEASPCQLFLFLITLAHLHGLSSQITFNWSSHVCSCPSASQPLRKLSSLSELSRDLSYPPHTCHVSGSANFLPRHPAVSLLFCEDMDLRMVGLK